MKRKCYTQGKRNRRGEQGTRREWQRRNESFCIHLNLNLNGKTNFRRKSVKWKKKLCERCAQPAGSNTGSIISIWIYITMPCSIFSITFQFPGNEQSVFNFCFPKLMSRNCAIIIPTDPFIGWQRTYTEFKVDAALAQPRNVCVFRKAQQSDKSIPVHSAVDAFSILRIL